MFLFSNEGQDSQPREVYGRRYETNQFIYLKATISCKIDPGQTQKKFTW